LLSKLLNNIVTWVLFICILLAIPPALLGVIGAVISILQRELTSSMAYSLLSLASVQIGVMCAKLYDNWTN